MGAVQGEGLRVDWKRYLLKSGAASELISHRISAAEHEPPLKANYVSISGVHTTTPGAFLSNGAH